MSYPLFEFHRDICGWLRFAETKNALLLTLSAAIFQFSLENSTFAWADWYPIMVAVFSAICAFTCLVSFTPIISLDGSGAKRKNSQFTPKKNEVTVYFGEIAKMSESDFCAHYLAVHSDLEAADKALLKQIHTNSIITYGKMRSFKIALFALIFGTFTPIIGIFAVFWVYHLKPKPLA